MTDSFAQSRVKWFMRHSYTWQQRLYPTPPPPANDTDEAWGVPDPVYGPVVTGKPCIFHDRGSEMHDAQGITVLAEPQMRVPWDDPINDTDIVLEVLDQTGNVLATGPLRVEVGTQYAPHGLLLWKVIPLVVTTVED